MARQRMIKPEFFDSESLGACSIPSRLAFIGLWVEADDYGRMKLQPKRLMKRIFPYDRINLSKFVSYLAELERVGCIRTYEVDGEEYIYVPNFNVYQTINRPSKSTIPEPPETDKSSIHTLLNEHSMSTHTKERKKERSSRASKSSTTKEEASSGAVAGEPAPLSAIPSCPSCKVAAKYKGGDRWVCPECGKSHSFSELAMEVAS